MNFFKNEINKFLKNNKIIKSLYYSKLFLLLIFCSICFEIVYFQKLNNLIFATKKQIFSSSNEKKSFEKNFEYHNYERELITEKIQNFAGYELYDNEPYFLNGIIRKFKPKKCLEIGVSQGGSSIVILNAIKDDNNSFLISLDLNDNLYYNESLKTGYKVKKYFPELAYNKWKLYTGRQPHIFLSLLKLKFDFLFLDTFHLAPGELINLIEVLPFLGDNAIIVLHDIMFHLPSLNYYNPKSIKFHPSNIYLMTSLIGEKIIIHNSQKCLENMGAIILYPNQEKYYLNYIMINFLLIFGHFNDF